MTTYNPTQEVQKTCLEIARRVTSIQNFIEFLKRENRFDNSTFVSKDYKAFERDAEDTAARIYDCECFPFEIPLSDFPYQEELDELDWWSGAGPLFGRRHEGKNLFWSLVDTGEIATGIVSFNVLYRTSGLFEVVEKEKFDLPDETTEYKSVKTGETLHPYDLCEMMRLLDASTSQLVSMGLIEALSPMQGTRYHYAPNFKKLNEMIELHNTLSPLVFECPVTLEKF